MFSVSLAASETKPVTEQVLLLLWKERLCRHCRAPFVLINTRTLEFICKGALMPLVRSSPSLSLFPISHKSQSVPSSSSVFAESHTFQFLQKRTGGKKPLPVLHLFYFITSLLGKLGQHCSRAICLHFLYKTILEL